MVVGLYGIRGIYNFGCEAIVRGAFSFINDIYKDPEIIYFSYNYEYDKQMLNDLDLKIVAVESKVTICKRVVNKILRIFEIEERCLFEDYMSIIEGLDEIWSIGGDIYTIPEVVRQQKKYSYYNVLIDFCNKAIKKGKSVVLYGASVGPFGEYKKAINYYVKNLKKYKMIMCRENDSLSYLKKIGVTANVVFQPDPAFSVEGKQVNLQKSQEYIGLNFSPLSLIEIYGGYTKDKIKEFAQIIDKMYDCFACEIMLIPHVVSREISDDDLRFQQQLSKSVRKDVREHIHIADYTQGFLGIKMQLSRCKIIVSARMHCAINAIVEAVPTILLSYSQKSKGISKYVYGTEEWVVGLDDINKQLIDKMHMMMSQREEIICLLQNRKVEIKREYRIGVDAFKNGKL